MTPKQQKALLALLTQPTKAKAAEAAGIAPKTLRTYLADPAFQAEYKKAFSGVVEDAVRLSQQSLSPALATLREIVEDSGLDAQPRIAAARSILEYSLKMTEQLDILDRLDELEKLAEGGRNG